MLEKYTLCGVDRHFLNTVVDSFRNTGFSSQGLSIALWTLFIALILFVLAYQLNRLRRRRMYISSSWITRPENIKAIFDKALNERSKFEVSFASTGLKRRTTHCALVDIKDDLMILEPPIKTVFSPQLVGREFRCFFGTTSDKSPNQRIYYTSVSQLMAVEPKADELVHLYLKLPLRLAVSQKRAHLRLSPPTKYLGDLALWPYNLESRKRFETMALGGQESLPTTVKFRLINLSAGGMFLEAVYANRLKMKEDSPRVGAECFVFLELLWPESDSRERFFLTARVRHRLEMGLTIRSGLEFLRHVYLNPMEQEKLLWMRLGSEGVSDMADWVMVRHLELFREHGYW